MSAVTISSSSSGCIADNEEFPACVKKDDAFVVPDGCEEEEEEIGILTTDYPVSSTCGNPDDPSQLQEILEWLQKGDCVTRPRTQPKRFKPDKPDNATDGKKDSVKLELANTCPAVCIRLDTNGEIITNLDNINPSIEHLYTSPLCHFLQQMNDDQLEAAACLHKHNGVSISDGVKAIENAGRALILNTPTSLKKGYIVCSFRGNFIICPNRKAMKNYAHANPMEWVIELEPHGDFSYILFVSHRNYWANYATDPTYGTERDLRLHLLAHINAELVTFYNGGICSAWTTDKNGILDTKPITISQPTVSICLTKALPPGKHLVFISYGDKYETDENA